jgi:hypothetical protein
MQFPGVVGNDGIGKQFDRGVAAEEAALKAAPGEEVLRRPLIRTGDALSQTHEF